jgi:hypothetical protein
MPGKSASSFPSPGCGWPQAAQGTDAIAVGRVLGLFKAHGHVGLGRQVVDLVGLHFLNDAHQAGGVGQVAVMQHEVAVVDVRILVQVVDAVGVEQAGAAFDAMHLVALFEQELRQIGTVLAGHARDQCYFFSHTS